MSFVNPKITRHRLPCGKYLDRVEFLTRTEYRLQSFTGDFMTISDVEYSLLLSIAVEVVL